MKLNKIITALSLAFVSSQGFASGFQINAQSATGVGRSFAGDGVIADNASVMSRNAAAMTLFDTTSISAGVIALSTDITLKNPVYNGTQLADQDVSGGGTSIIPNIFVIIPINDKWSTGIGMFAAFGSETTYDDSFPPDVFTGKTKIQGLDLKLNVAYRINDKFSIGGGIDGLAFTGTLYREFKAAGMTSANPALDIDTTAYALGFNLGFMYEMDKNNRIGLSYQKNPNIKSDDPFFFQGQKFTNGNLKLSLPDVFDFSGFHQITDKFALHYSATYTMWGEFDAISSDATGVIKQYDWQDSLRIALGGTYKIDDTWTVRAGIMHDSSAVDQLKYVSIPDSDRMWYSAGLSYSFTPKSSLDFGLAYVQGSDVDVVESIPGFVQLTGTTRANAWYSGVQYNYKF